MPSFIPTKEAEFVSWSANLIDVSKANTTGWDLPAAQITELETLHGEFIALYEKCQTAAYTKLDMQAKNEKKALLIKKEEVFVRNNLQNNDKMTDNGRTALRIPIYDRKPTPHPAPETTPEIEIATPLPRILRVKFRAVNAARWGKPPYVHGLECLWSIADTPPAKIGDLLHSTFATRSPLELGFDEDQRGKRVYFAVRWESGTVKKGPWSDIFSAIVP
ncbi:MAG: hypothetical protein LBQ88_10355 [Treponema sp.]|jgi:hypothetical protein|nr:hypothetical protein [Treponema sp.]